VSQQHDACQPIAYRRFEVVRTPEGNRQLNVQVVPAGAALEGIMAVGDVISDAEIRELLRGLGWDDADADELKELGYLLNVMRVTKPQEVAVPNPPELRRVAAALSVLRADLPTLIETTKKALASAGPQATKRGMDRHVSLLLNMGSLLRDAYKTSADPFFEHKRLKTNRPSYWHRDLACLVFILDGMAKKRGLPVSFTKKGSASANFGRGVTFIEKAFKRAGVKQASGKSITSQMISVQARRQHKELLPEYFLDPPELAEQLEN
jgi:hypothetical protein